MEAALRTIQKSNVGIDVLHEDKITKGIHTCYIAGYKV